MALGDITCYFIMLNLRRIAAEFLGRETGGQVSGRARHLSAQDLPEPRSWIYNYLKI